MTTWVFLRGLTREARHWGDFPARFRAVFGQELAPGDLLLPDLAGNGRRYLEPSPSRVEDIMESCRADLARRGHPPPYHLLALSLGGMVALSWAARHPEECCGAVLISTSLRPWCPFNERLRPAIWPTVLALMTTAGETRERAILHLTSGRAAELSGLVPVWSGYARECPVSRANTLRQLMAASRFSCRERPAVPLLFLAGGRDRMVHPHCSQTVAQAWRAGFSLHPWAGHDLPLDDGDWVSREVCKWLRG
jgi:pimeloyl-ACP methyl ester carboxylesterase